MTAADYRSKADLDDRSVDDLLDYATKRVPTLRQMHALEALARRAVDDPGLLPRVLPPIAARLGNAHRMGGLPVGYLGAAVLHGAGGDAARALSVALATVPPLERDDLVRWLRAEGDGSETAPSSAPSPLPIERDLLLADLPTEASLIEALTRASGSTAKVDLIALQGVPAAMAMVALPPSAWTALDHRAEELAAALDTTVYLWAPEDLGGVHPDLRLSVAPDGQRALVIAEGTPDGYAVRPFAG